MPTHASVVILPDRGVLAIGGPDRIPFLQGLVSNDVERTSSGDPVYAALLTPQGKFLHDMIIAARGELLLVDCEAERRDDLIRRLKPYRLRSKVTIDDATADWAVAVAPDATSVELVGQEPMVDAAVAFVDPRHPALGVRMLVPQERAAAMGQTGDVEAYDRLRLSLGVPDGSRDLVPEKSILLENGFDALNGISWDKGCYMGQELTARTRYRGLVKKRLVPVRVDGRLPAPGTMIELGEADAGEMRSGRDGLGLALVRLDALHASLDQGSDARLRADGAWLTPIPPPWFKLSPPDPRVT